LLLQDTGISQLTSQALGKPSTHACMFSEVSKSLKSQLFHIVPYTQDFPWLDCKGINLSAFEFLSKVSGGQFISAKMGDLYESVILVFILFLI